MKINNKSYSKLNNLRDYSLGILAGALLATNVATAQNKPVTPISDRNYIKADPKTGNALVIDNFLTANPFTTVCSGEDFIMPLKTKEDITDIKYKVITVNEYEKLAQKSIDNQIREKQLAKAREYLENRELRTEVADWFKEVWTRGDYKKINPDTIKVERPADARILDAVKSSHYNKLNKLGKISNSIEISLNDLDKNYQGKNENGIITIKEWNEIVSELKKNKYNNMTVAILAETTDCNNHKELVPYLINIENCAYNSNSNKKTIPKPKSEDNKNKKVEDKNKSALENIVQSENKKETKPIAENKNDTTTTKPYSKTVNIFVTNNYPKTSPDTAFIPAKADTVYVPKENKLRIRPYLAAGAEYNFDSNKIMPLGAAGLQIGIFGIGGNFGFLNYPSQEYKEFPNGQGNGGTYITTANDYNIKQYGGEISIDILKFMKGYFSIQNNSVEKTSTETVRQDVDNDIVGNPREHTVVFDPVKQKENHIRYVPGLGFNLNKNFSLYGGVPIENGKVNSVEGYIRYTFGGNKENTKSRKHSTYYNNMQPNGDKGTPSRPAFRQ